VLCCAVLCCAVLPLSFAIEKRFAMANGNGYDGKWYIVKTATVVSWSLPLLFEKQRLMCGMCICSLLLAKEGLGQLRVELPQGQGLL
jgi:hypothetical protein